MSHLPKVEGNYPDGLELVLLQVVHRHGERTPVRTRLENLFPPIWQLCEANSQMFAAIKELNNGKMLQVPLNRLVEGVDADNQKVNHPPNSCFAGQLTNAGRQSTAALGARLREIYIDRLKFLPDVFDEDAVYIRSTDYTRTQESVSQVIASGLYPPGKRPENFTLNIRSRTPFQENLYPNPNCYRLRHLAKKFRAQVGEMCKEELASLSTRLRAHVKEVSLDSHPSANGILDTLTAGVANGFKLPPDIDDQIMRDLEDVVVKEWFYGTMESEEVRRLSMGPLLGDIRDRMVRRADHSDKAIGEDKHKLAVYSGHDTTIAPLLISLGWFDMRWPPFTSVILFEHFQQKSKGTWWSSGKEENYVRVRYNDKVLELPGCAAEGKHHSNGDKSLCTLDAFKAIVEKLVPKNWKEECQI